jgi:hypothetical protein
LLTDPESRVLWPVYDEYEVKVRGVDDRLIRPIDDYAAKYSTMTPNPTHSRGSPIR